MYIYICIYGYIVYIDTTWSVRKLFSHCLKWCSSDTAGHTLMLRKCCKGILIGKVGRILRKYLHVLQIAFILVLGHGFELLPGFFQSLQSFIFFKR